MIDTNGRNQIVFIGDIHGEFGEMEYNVRRRVITDSYLIQVGDFGMGFNKPNYYRDVLSKMNRKLKEKNNHLYVIRGNHDDPEYFETTNNPFDLSNITLLADYSELLLLDKRILCVGGAVSVDRNRRVPGVSWWEKEPFIFNETAISEGSKEFDIVVTHTRPAVCGAYKGFSNIQHLILYDELLEDDLIQESKEMNKLYELVKPKLWFYGHFHDSIFSECENTTFRCLNIHQIYGLP